MSPYIGKYSRRSTPSTGAPNRYISRKGTPPVTPPSHQHAQSGKVNNARAAMIMMTATIISVVNLKIFSGPASRPEERREAHPLRGSP